MEFDYVIVGGGSGGATLAGRLSEDPNTTVCLLEAGGKGDGFLIRAPAMVAAMVSGRPKLNNWALKTTPQPGLNGRRGFQPRGRALGGSSAINAMLYVRGHRADYDEWAQLGAKGWGWNDVLPFFLKAEGNARGADDLHSTDGPLQVGDISDPHAISPAFVEAAKQCQHPENRDFNGATQEGVGLYQVTQFHDGPKRGERCSAAAAYLLPHLSRPQPACDHRHPGPPRAVRRAARQWGQARQGRGPRAARSHPVGRGFPDAAAPDAVRDRPGRAPAQPRD